MHARPALTRILTELLAMQIFRTEVSFHGYFNFVAVVDLLVEVPVPRPDFHYM